MNDKLIRFLLPETHTRGAIIRGSNIVAEASRIHGLTGQVAELFGQALLSSILLLSINKGGMRQVLQLDALPGSLAPVKRIMAETSHGAVRGYLGWREEKISMHGKSEHCLSRWMGGVIRLSTVRDLGVGQPYISTIEHDSEFLADHLVHYLNQSVQTRADVILSGDLALMIEAMPDCDEEQWFEAVKCLASIPDSELAGADPAQILSRFTGLGCHQAGTDVYAYHCNCTLEKMRDAIESIPGEQLLDLADEHGKIRVSCQYCDKFYEVEVAQEHG
ncbi:MAG TPA: Hsp33 family molecular chaperone HslO [Mariprofundaceae bacterium]|nr:Hsp33 family molecular chaperone HslO [Mariprofundaceae bacterium]